MIEWIRKHMGWMMWIIVGLVTVTFLFFGIYPSSDAGRSMAKVGGYVISTEEFNQAYRNLYENYRNMLKDQVSDTVTKSLRQQALQELIVNRNAEELLEHQHLAHGSSALLEARAGVEHRGHAAERELEAIGNAGREFGIRESGARGEQQRERGERGTR